MVVQVFSIEEVIDSLIAHELDTFFIELPLETEGVLIEENNIKGSIQSFKGFDGVINSRLKLYMRVKIDGDNCKDMGSYLLSLYKQVAQAKGKEIEGIKLLYVDEPSLSSTFTTKEGNYEKSLDFSVIYRYL